MIFILFSKFSILLSTTQHLQLYKNIYQEIPAHVSKQEKKKKKKKKKIKETIENLFNGKEAKNYSDYWKSLLVLCSFLLEKSPGSYIT